MIKIDVPNFSPEFLEMLTEEAILTVLGKITGAEHDLLDNAYFVIYCLWQMENGCELSEDDSHSLAYSVGEITRGIWTLGGTFYNSSGEKVR